MAVDVGTDRRTEVLKALVDDLGIPQPLVSHHLRALRAAGIVESERFKQWAYYRLLSDAMAAVADDFAALTKGTARRGARRRPCC